MDSAGHEQHPAATAARLRARPAGAGYRRMTFATSRAGECESPDQRGPNEARNLSSGGLSNRVVRDPRNICDGAGIKLWLRARAFPAPRPPARPARSCSLEPPRTRRTSRAARRDTVDTSASPMRATRPGCTRGRPTPAAGPARSTQDVSPLEDSRLPRYRTMPQRHSSTPLQRSYSSRRLSHDIGDAGPDSSRPFGTRSR